jgi:hypothetical protein
VNEIVLEGMRSDFQGKLFDLLDDLLSVAGEVGGQRCELLDESEIKGVFGGVFDVFSYIFDLSLLSPHSQPK